MLQKIVIAGLVAAWSVVGRPVQALSMAEAGKPAEMPPANFSGIQFVDSRGCIYLRAGYGSEIIWLPRVTRMREVICGQNSSEPAVTHGPIAAPPLVSTRGAISPRTGFPVPHGYKVAWEDGRLNPLRGLPQGAAQ